MPVSSAPRHLWYQFSFTLYPCLWQLRLQEHFHFIQAGMISSAHGSGPLLMPTTQTAGESPWFPDFSLSHRVLWIRWASQQQFDFSWALRLQVKKKWISKRWRDIIMQLKGHWQLISLLTNDYGFCRTNSSCSLEFSESIIFKCKGVSYERCIYLLCAAVYPKEVVNGLPTAWWHFNTWSSCVLCGSRNNKWWNPCLWGKVSNGYHEPSQVYCRRGFIGEQRSSRRHSGKWTRWSPSACSPSAVRASGLILYQLQRHQGPAKEQPGCEQVSPQAANTSMLLDVLMYSCSSSQVSTCLHSSYLLASVQNSFPWVRTLEGKCASFLVCPRCAGQGWHPQSRLCAGSWGWTQGFLTQHCCLTARLLVVSVFTVATWKSLVKWEEKLFLFLFMLAKRETQSWVS